MSAPRPLHSSMARFGVVGAANSLIDLSIFSLAIWSGGAPLFANFLGWLTAAAFSYALNSRWSFDRDRNMNEAVSVLRFMVSGAVVTLGVTSGVLLALGGVIGVLPAKLAGLALAAAINFMAARWSIENRLF